MEKVFRIIGLSLAILFLSFGAGYFTGRSGDKEPAGNTPDTSGIDRIINLARSGLIEERADIDRSRIEIADERKRIAEEREIDQRERDRIITERKGYADIEKLCRDTIRILQDRGTERKMEK